MPGGARRVLLAGATGTIGRATARALRRHGHEVLALVRPLRDGSGPDEVRARIPALDGCDIRSADVTDPASLARDGLAGERVDAVISCLASRTGAPADAWAVEHRAQGHLLAAATAAGARQFVLLSAICVQKPRLAFQHAKLAFERELAASGIDYAIVRPTAFHKSLSGQVERVRRGKPFLLFGDGTLTACKPIDDDDLAEYLVGCLDDPVRRNRILPIGGPGPAQTPREQGEALFALLGRAPRFTRVPVAMMDAIIGVLGALGRVAPPLADKAEFARIGRYYATESMLVWDEARGRYDANATPETGTRTLLDYQARLLRGERQDDRGQHAVF
ncbi:MAG: NAD(P)H-binding protein [Gemmatimonadales bacterium]|nr:NAD(P)H-binding protein [Gemmatimonadales bacterium]